MNTNLAEELEALQAKYEVMDRQLLNLIADMAVMRYEMDFLKEQIDIIQEGTV